MSGRGPSELTTAIAADVEYAESWLLRAVSGKFGHLLLALVALLVSSPMIVEGGLWDLLLRLFASAVLVASLQAARPGRRSLWIGLGLAVVDLVIGRLTLIAGARWLVVLQVALWLGTLIFVTIVILDAVFTSENVDAETVQAVLCAYLLLGLIWVFLYGLIDLADPSSFRLLRGVRLVWSDGPTRRADFLRLLVFSYSTLTTSGFGDLAPASGFASICANLEALSGQVYLTVVIARVVGMQVERLHRRRTQHPGASGVDVPASASLPATPSETPP
jgi:hypothetical protein